MPMVMTWTAGFFIVTAVRLLSNVRWHCCHALCSLPANHHLPHPSCRHPSRDVSVARPSGTAGPGPYYDACSMLHVAC